MVISDLHLGNPFSKASREAANFLRAAAREGFDICINGDGLEIAQASFRKLKVEIPELLRAIREVTHAGRSVYYVVGNHDILLEHFLEDWGALKVAPFLNVHSAGTRIRIEHGHLYDPFFVKSPIAYEVLTHLGGYLLKIHPAIYRAWIAFERFRAQLRFRKTGILGEPTQFAEAAHALSQRGFDYVVFGHTHHPGETRLPDGNRYLNSGSWLLSRHFVRIENGAVRLEEWSGAF